MFGLFKKTKTASPATTTEAPIVVTPPETTPKDSWITRLRQGLQKTRLNLSDRVHTLFLGHRIPEETLEELESILLSADMGIEATEWLLAKLREEVKHNKLNTPEQWQEATKRLLVELLSPLEKPLDFTQHKPFVIMIAGVNGAGKTTSIGKLAHWFQSQGLSVLLAAGDTFRAAAQEQLSAWGERNHVDVISQNNAPPATVAYDAVHAGKARGVDIVMIDTAGRLPTQLHLMDEIAKIHRVITKADPTAPHEVLIVLDGTTGQNALQQVKAFDNALNVTGLLMTKLDGSAKGGTIAAIAKTHPIPLRFIGVGEDVDDLRPFVATEFIDALFRASSHEPTP